MPLAGILETCIENSHRKSNPLTARQLLSGAIKMSGIRTTTVDFILNICYYKKYVHTKIGQARLFRLKYRRLKSQNGRFLELLEGFMSYGNKKRARWISCLLGIGVLVALVSVTGCDNDTYQTVNLSAAVPEEIQVSGLPDQIASGAPKLRVAVAAMISPRQTLVYYEALLNYIGEQTGHEIDLLQRKTYAEVNELFPKGLIDLAFVCSGPYANAGSAYGFEGLATPVVRGEPYYQSYLIVHKTSTYQSLADLKGKMFAFTDPDSNTGALVPGYWLMEANQSPSDFFSRITYTYSHDNSILAVARGLVDGAAVDGHKWEYFQAADPFFTGKTRVIRKSDKYGSPPLVAAAFLDDRLKAQIQEAVLAMHTTESGKQILDRLMIDRFVVPRPEWYQPIQAMQNALAQGG
jgi:phosphonate transport system substrate-binding protein